MLVVGQSGSGKSFMLARLMEEILLRTRARIVIVDPNGDFRLFSECSNHDHFHKRFAARFNVVAKACATNGWRVLDDYDSFLAGWESRFFQYVDAHRERKYIPDEEYEDRVRHSALFIHWAHLHQEQDFLIDTLEVEHSGKAKINMARQAIEKYLGEQVKKGYFPQGYGLLELIGVAEQFLRRDIGLEDYAYVKDLSTDDWWLVYAYLQQLYYRYEWLWWHHPAVRHQNGVEEGVERKKDLLGHLLRPFSKHHPWDEWNACIIGLDRASPDDALLAVNFALFRIWKSAQYCWRIALENQRDDRVPTFVVLDEAHNFAPLEARNNLQKRVTDKLVQMAAEGRKYGVYLILATQRPRKLHPSVVLECENVCLLRVQSQLEQDFAEKEFAIPHDLARGIHRYKLGQALLSGRWVEGDPIEAQIAPARAVVGGGGVPNLWMTPPSLERRSRPHLGEVIGSAAAADEDEEMAAALSATSAGDGK
nr:DUF87 domain-containing protein [Bradyrhizobium sp. 173]